MEAAAKKNELYMLNMGGKNTKPELKMYTSNEQTKRAATNRPKTTDVK